MVEGQIYNQESFLSNISKKLGKRDFNRSMEDWKNPYEPQKRVFSDLSKEELLTEFKLASEKIHTEVIESNLENLYATLLKQISAHGNGSVITSKDERFKEYGLMDLFNEESVYQWEISRDEENIAIAEKANIGIMFSDITLAESATIVILNDSQKARSISLLPTTFIAIVPKSSIVPRFTQAADKIEQLIENKELVPSCVNFISGPSNSADIEFNLVVGVHGPIKVSYIVVNDM